MKYHFTVISNIFHFCPIDTMGGNERPEISTLLRCSEKLFNRSQLSGSLRLNRPIKDPSRGQQTAEVVARVR